MAKKIWDNFKDNFWKKILVVFLNMYDYGHQKLLIKIVIYKSLQGVIFVDIVVGDNWTLPASSRTMFT